jgi:hypothetical protein
VVDADAIKAVRFCALKEPEQFGNGTKLIGHMEPFLVGALPAQFFVAKEDDGAIANRASRNAALGAFGEAAISSE